jgi:hypothetical protein
MNDRVWATSAHRLYFGYAETLAETPIQAGRALEEHLPQLLGRPLGGGRVIAVGLDRTGRKIKIPHLGYSRLCESGCDHAGPSSGGQAWRCFGLWLLVAGAGTDSSDARGAVEVGPLRVEVVGRVGHRRRRTFTLWLSGADPVGRTGAVLVGPLRLEIVGKRRKRSKFAD